MYWIYDTEDAAEAALAEIDAEMGFAGDITTTWAETEPVEAGPHAGAWALPAPPPDVQTSPPDQVVEKDALRPEPVFDDPQG